MTKSYPLIGISGSINMEETQHMLLRDYMQGVVMNGGIPLLMSPDMDDEALSACLERIDGLLLAGGNDVAPNLFNEWPQQGLGEVTPLRDMFEFKLVKEAEKRRLPTLGICRGIQVMNAALGGTLYQDLPTEYRTHEEKQCMKHAQQCPGRYASHQVNVAPGTLLSRIVCQKTLDVNSFHHQAVKAVAPCFRVCATATDGVIEAVEHKELPFFIGVQWHPERMLKNTEYAVALFHALVKACVFE